MATDLKKELLDQLRTNATPLKAATPQATASGHILAWEHYVVITELQPTEAAAAKATSKTKLQLDGKPLTEENTVADLIKALGV